MKYLIFLAPLLTFIGLLILATIFVFIVGAIWFLFKKFNKK